MKTFIELTKNLKGDHGNLPNYSVAFLGDSASQFIVQAIRGLGIDEGLNLNIWQADFNQIEQQVFDPNSEFYNFQPQIVILCKSTHNLLNQYNKISPENQIDFGNDQLTKMVSLLNTINSNLNTKIICFNYAEIDDAVFGSFSNTVESSFLFQLRKINFELMVFASKNQGAFICDISSLQNQIGKQKLFNPVLYVNSEMVFSIESLPLISSKVLDIIKCIHGKFKKCIILDLDNTMWGGIIGDDGIENIQLGSLGIGKAFTEFQYWIKKLKNRGIIVAVCSKNTESVAKEPFEKHPEMVLRLNDISVFVANWENKADNIRYIQGILNIGFDSMVFIDDNPFERNLVRENIPEICVPELPEDPSEYLEFLYSLNLFETTSFSNLDIERTKQYQVEAERINLQKKFANEDEFLNSLDMYSIVEPFNKFNTPRVAQLTQRSNQFNLRTIRYTDLEISRLSNSDDYFTFTFTLGDKFGDHGLIGIIILKKEDQTSLFIDTWIMSCRVLKRTMENFVLNTLVKFALENNYKLLKGEFISTPKNDIVRNHYQDLGFIEENEFWILNLENYQSKKTFIRTN